MRKLLFLPALIFITISLKAQNLGDSSTVSPGIFQLGEVTVKATRDKDIIETGEINRHNATDVSRALKTLPSVTFISSGSRNESTVFVRGFDIRSVPLYIDGIPVSVPYDGYIDLGRFTVYDISRIEVSKGNASIMYGSNALGGAINLIGMKPAGKFELTAKTGILSGKGYEAMVNVGGSNKNFYYQLGLSTLKNDYLPLPEKFDTTHLEKDHNRDNSYRRDSKMSVKLGFTPNVTDEYSLSYIYSEGSKGNPVYLGNDQNVRVRYWQWPYWDKQSVYWISKTALGSHSIFKTRLFYDQFKNKLSSFDDATYTLQERRSSFNSYYNDRTVGGNMEFWHDFSPNHNMRIALHLKNDSHEEHNDSEPVRHFSDNTFFIGFENSLNLSTALKLIPGLGYSYRKTLKAEDFNPDDQSVTAMPLKAVSAVNAQVTAIYRIRDGIAMNLSVAYKNRFPTMKDRYSYRQGTTLTNPDLKSEFSLNMELGADIQFNSNLRLHPELFYSRLNNTLQMVSNVDGDLSQLQNTGSSYFAGADMIVEYKPVRNLNLSGIYSYIKRKNLDNPDIVFIDVPEHTLTCSASLTVLKKLTLYAGTAYNSERLNASDGSRISSSFFTTDSQVSINDLRGLNLSAGINNVFDKEYTLEEGYPEAGRNFFVSLGYKFRSVKY